MNAITFYHNNNDRGPGKKAALSPEASLIIFPHKFSFRNYLVEFSENGLLTLKMSVLQVLPRLASWGNLHKRRSPSRELEDEYDRITNDIEAMADTNPGHKNRRKKISYWSEDEDRLVTNGRFFSWKFTLNIYHSVF